ncbi:MAG: prepilin-type N-terminal cleavage/methylation domain-containing protein [Nitrospira sp.]|nr:prepilin-type N-terminal cleavage/methylation domain-containing protein [Nitrospira sp.]MDH4303114.1 prepilin-type N-terminal cleavage/methylation domain-containing protein [Nitrospira sp.]MDH5192467.1 prepilin-type N-terminal cleavage/methylation domain-containing protein [Nitrospira sp.]
MRDAGLTLVEILITMTIMAILASVAMPLSKVSTKRMQEIELRQQLRTIRSAIDLFKLEWNRDGDVLLGPACVKNRLVCKEVSGQYGYPKSLETLLGVKLTGEEATVRGTTMRRYLRNLPIDPLTGKADWLLRCYKDQPKPMSWCGEDVYDVLTQSEAVAIDGTKYQDW